MTWEEFWVYFDHATTEQRRWMWKELLRDDWMKNLSSSVQFDILKYAPMDVLKVLKQFPDVFKRDTLIMLQRSIND